MVNFKNKRTSGSPVVVPVNKGRTVLDCGDVMTNGSYMSDESIQGVDVVLEAGVIATCERISGSQRDARKPCQQGRGACCELTIAVKLYFAGEKRLRWLVLHSSLPQSGPTRFNVGRSLDKLVSKCQTRYGARRTM